MTQRVEIVCSSEIRRGYSKNHFFCVHPFFQSSTKWPKKTHIHCYYDTFPFDTPPVPLPNHYDETTDTYVCDVGIFCSGECAKSYLIHNPRHNNAIRLMLLDQILRRMFPNIPETIHEAPPISMLQRFGGTLTIEEFRQAHNQYSHYSLHQPHFLVCDLAFELLNHQTNSESKTTAPIPVPVSLPDSPPSHRTRSRQKKKNSMKNMDQKLEVVPSNSANKWEIRNIRRPSKTKPFQPATDYRDTNSLYTEYIQERKTMKQNEILFDQEMDDVLVSSTDTTTTSKTSVTRTIRSTRSTRTTRSTRSTKTAGSLTKKKKKNNLQRNLFKVPPQ